MSRWFARFASRAAEVTILVLLWLRLAIILPCLLLLACLEVWRHPKQRSRR